MGLSDEGRELALAIDQYKVQHHRRYLTCDEMLSVLTDLGYEKQSSRLKLPSMARTPSEPRPDLRECGRSLSLSDC